MVFSNVYLGFEMLERALNLPEGVKIVAVRDSDQQTQHLMLRIVSPERPRDIVLNINTDPISKIGEAYLPELNFVKEAPPEDATDSSATPPAAE